MPWQLKYPGDDWRRDMPPRMVALRRLVAEAVYAANCGQGYRRLDKRFKIAAELVVSGNFRSVRVGMAYLEGRKEVRDMAVNLGAFDFWPDEVNWLYTIPLINLEFFEVEGMAWILEHDAGVDKFASAYVLAGRTLVAQAIRAANKGNQFYAQDSKHGIAAELVLANGSYHVRVGRIVPPLPPEMLELAKTMNVKDLSRGEVDWLYSLPLKRKVSRKSK